MAGIHFNPTILICNLLKMNQFNSLMDEKMILDYYVNNAQTSSKISQFQGEDILLDSTIYNIDPEQ